jgi:hypothetical protein
MLWEEPACRRCAMVGTYLAKCTHCNFCVFCKREGHLVATCLRVPPCRICGQKGHKTNKCPNSRYLHRRGWKLQRSRAPPATHITCNSEESAAASTETKSPPFLSNPGRFSARTKVAQSLSRTVQSPKHDSKDWLDLGIIAAQVCHGEI